MQATTQVDVLEFLTEEVHVQPSYAVLEQREVYRTKHTIR